MAELPESEFGLKCCFFDPIWAEKLPPWPAAAGHTSADVALVANWPTKRIRSTSMSSTSTSTSKHEHTSVRLESTGTTSSAHQKCRFTRRWPTTAAANTATATTSATATPRTAPAPPRRRRPRRRRPRRRRPRRLRRRRATRSTQGRGSSRNCKSTWTHSSGSSLRAHLVIVDVSATIIAMRIVSSRASFADVRRRMATTMAPMILVDRREQAITAGHGVGRLGIEPRTRGLKDGPEPFQGVLDFPE